MTVEGRLWGVIIAISTDPEPIPERSEVRLGQFTELVATAVANAEARDALAQLADEQAALRRVATLVARGVEPEVIFSAVGEEIGRLFGTSISAVGRFERRRRRSDAHDVGVGVGDTIEPDPAGARTTVLPVASVFRTERSVRIDEMDWSTGGPVAEVARQLGVVFDRREPDLRGGAPVGRDDRLRHQATSARRRGTTGEVHRAGRNGDRERRELGRARRVAAADRRRRRRGAPADRARPPRRHPAAADLAQLPRTRDDAETAGRAARPRAPSSGRV